MIRFTLAGIEFTCGKVQQSTIKRKHGEGRRETRPLAGTIADTAYQILIENNRPMCTAEIRDFMVDKAVNGDLDERFLTMDLGTIYTRLNKAKDILWDGPGTWKADPERHKKLIQLPQSRRLEKKDAD